jgi:hypothetical protein
MPARLVLAALLASASAGAWAGGLVFCDPGRDTSAAQQDRVLRFTAVIKQELARSGARVALVARAGLDLKRFDLVYSHAGIALKDDADGSWSVRQLYYACDEARPRLFDQGLPGFALGADTPDYGHVALVFLPPAQADLLAAAARDKRLALALLAGQYSANAYAYSTRYQNCNQWVIEMLASAWGQLDAADDPRAHAQDWLRAHGYVAGPVVVHSHWLMFIGQFVPLIHVDDHPVDDLYAHRLRVSVPASIEAFVHQHSAAAERVELCHDTERVVVHRGWEPMGAHCAAAPGDDIVPLSP